MAPKPSRRSQSKAADAADAADAAANQDADQSPV